MINRSFKLKGPIEKFITSDNTLKDLFNNFPNYNNKRLYFNNIKNHLLSSKKNQITIFAL